MMTLRYFLTGTLFLASAVMLVSFPAFAQVPEMWGLNFQDAASTSMERIAAFHDFMIWVIVSISVFVLLLLVWVVIRYNRRMNPEPADFSHNVFIEVLWTVVPVVILIVIALQSLPLLYYGDRTAEPDMAIKITGYQWYWGYEYPDHEGINFLAYPVEDEDIDPDKGQVRNLSTDVPVVLPVDQNIQILAGAADVIHSWAIPAFGVKMDTIPGRLNETWVKITKPGVYFGQCSELCGKNHSFMPIEVHAVTLQDFQEWVAASAKLGEAAPSPLVSASGQIKTNYVLNQK